ncbi:LysR family transcriptional regulator (plasmid) [Lichenicola cladoniae]|uniref:LysR family transcriptional regulator n=1 Tax=Lichenicola cladoniae TaxID=1484109 RepID=A0A6M8HZF2_9PROT|nr:LysR family transcriptional regulator [Lichenicola cladoniae]NPD69685.1 LysR family transcriptional regulator [Acetobacteraceae bacterium]QKE93944.1 LysR family transcriptional regulator [Lichenicola cladoniae]
MDRFHAMRVFTRIVERRSFTHAAEDLGLPRSSVTDAVKALEARLGVPLLQRTTRHVSPTLDGEAYYQRCLRLIADLEDAEGALTGAKPQGMLHVNVHGTMASHFIVPHLPGFLAEYPGVELFISEGDRYVDLVRDGVDCAIRVGRLPDSDLITRRLTTLEETTCVSPSYLARHGVPQDLDALDGHRMVGFHSSATGSVLPLEFISNGVARTVILPASITVSGAETYAAAARMGLGLIQAPRYRLEEDFRRGTLSPVLTDTPPSPSPVSVLYPRAKQLSPRLRTFLNWLFAKIRNETAAE